MLLVLDIHIDGVIRERLLVSYYRYCAQHYAGRTTVDDVCKLMRSTGFGTSKRPQDYPVDYFKFVIFPALDTFGTDISKHFSPQEDSNQRRTNQHDHRAFTNG